MDIKVKQRNARLERIFNKEPNLAEKYYNGLLELEVIPAMNIFKFVGKDAGYIRKIDPKVD